MSKIVSYLLRLTAIVFGVVSILLLIAPKASANEFTQTGTYMNSPYSYCDTQHTYYDLYSPGGNITITQGTPSRTITFYGKVHACSTLSYEWALWPHINFYNVNSRLSGLSTNLDMGEPTLYGLGSRRGNIYTVARNVTVDTSGLGPGVHNICFNWRGWGYHGFWDHTIEVTYCVSVTVNAPPPPQSGNMQITMYGPNNGSRIFNAGYIWPGGLWPGNDRFNMCMAYFGKIANSCTGGHVQSPNVSLSPATYTVYRDNNIDTDGWYINYVQRAQNGPIVPDSGFDRYAFAVANNQQVYADVHLEKYASQCRDTTFSVAKPKPGEEFTATFNMQNPGGITNWSHGAGVRMKVFIPSQFEILTAPAGAYDDPPEVGLEGFLGNKIHLQIFYPGNVASGSTFTRTLRLKVKDTAPPGSIAKFPRSMIFPPKSPAANPYGSPFNPGCDSQIEIGTPVFYPWLQTKYGDVSAADFVSGQKYNQPGSREATSSEKEATNVIMATAADQQFCSVNLYALGTNPKVQREQCRNGRYAEDQRFGDIDTAINNAWNQNGAGSSPGCNPRYGTQKLTGSTKVGANLSSCANGTIYQVNGGASLSSLLAGQPSQGRATIWVKGNLTVDRTVIYNYAASYAKPEDIPNLAIYVEGDVIIQSSINQLDAAIISTGKIKTCGSDYSTTASAPTCGSQLVVHGYLFANGGYQFGRNYYVETSNTNPAEKIVLTGQSIAFPPPGLDKASLGNNDLKITEEDNPRVK